MRILLITQWFDPEPTFKGLLFAKELIQQGHEVQVLTGFPNYPGGKVYDGYKIRSFQREVVEGVNVLRLPLYPSHDGSSVKRVLNYASFAASASVGVLAGKRPDVAYVYHPPATVGLPALVAKWLRGVPFVYDVQDLWPDTLGVTGMLNRPKILRAVGKAMAGIYGSAARVAVLSPGFKKLLVERGVPERRIDVIPNWADEKQIDVSAPTASRASELGFDDRFTVTFAGNMGTVQALDTVLDAAALLRDRQEIRIVLVGGGLDLERLRGRSTAMKLDNVTFLARRPIAEIGEILTLSDALLVHLRRDPLFAITIPSKTQAYLMAGRPILMGVEGDAADMVEKAAAGIAFEPENAEALAAAIRRLQSLAPEQRRAMGESGSRFYREKLALKVGTAQFIESLEQASLLRPRFLAVKRATDVAASLAGLVALCVPMGVVALAVRAKLGGPVIFKQARPGKDGKLFSMYKFRTMTDERHASGGLLPDGLRLTRFGSMLRRSSLDELPGLVNVLRGDMSLIGPRPLLVRYTEHFTEAEMLRLAVKPGITGWAQVNGRNTASWDARLAMDVWYVRNLSFRLDLRILALTVLRVVKSSGIEVDPESKMLNFDDERRAARKNG
ncbi:sugar transferase [Conyzicola nivalis]|uniref:sugar transferase n=1 Tax=Conyzicola nivalis TaxID=1477021 RepID=UPI003397EEAB